MQVPESLKYTADHEWIRIEADVVTVGITDFAQGELGDIVFVELPESGDSFEQNDTFGTIEAVKAVSDLISPISGEIIEINEKLDETPELINTDPYGDGWMIKIKIDNSEELTDLLDAKAYEGLI